MWNVKWNFLAKILIFLASTAAVEAVQRFVEMPTYTEVNPGEDALLKCRISDKRGVCSWQKDNKPVGIYRGKYEWANEDSPAGGDCSLWVRAATLQLDDGQWQCQVTASNYDVQDALSSPPAALAVRVPPQTPRILFNGSLVMPGQNITVPAGARATVVCEARFGNPPAYIEWFLEKERLAAWSQTNASEAERPRVWAARSVLELGATRSAHGRQLSCRAHHPSYPAPRFKESYTMLDVTFVPVVSIVGADPSNLANLEESASALALECKADGNPSPYIWWTKDGQVISTNGPKLYLAPVHRNHSGIYGCQARNTLGTSDSVKVEINIKYPPKVTWVGPDTIVETNLFSQVTLECQAEGNPTPSYQWYHNPTPGAHINAPDGYPVSGTPQLQLLNVSYAQHGHYACVATNVIGAQERSHQSEPITLNVLGPPVGADTGTAHAVSGTEGKVSATVCADPPPRRAAWLWGSLRLEVPSQIGRYRSLEPTGVNGCYRYTLLISSTSASDARVYVLHVENERGFSSHAVSLTVHEWHFSLTEGAHVAPLIAAALAAAALLVLLVCLLLRCRRRRESVEYKTDDLDSEKTVLPADAVYAPPRSGSVLGVSSTGPRPGPAGGPPPGMPGGPGGAGGGGGARYSPGALQAALTSLEREAKENVYAVLDPHIQYEITINKHGEPPKYLSLSKPLSHQRAQAFDTQNFTEINNNNDLNENRFTTFKSGPPKARRSNRSADKKDKNDKSIICKSNNDIEYTQNPYFGIYGVESTSDLHTQRMNEQKSMKNYSRMYERHNSGRKNNVRNNIDNDIDNFKADVKRSSNRSRREEKNNVKSFPREMEKERSFEEYNAEAIEKRGADEYLPRPGKVREIASKFNRNSSSGHSKKKERPKPLQGYGNQYLDHVFPDAVEV